MNYQPPSMNPRVIIIEEVPVIPNYSHCAVCNQTTDTYETYRDGLFIWLMCIFLFLFTFCLFWVPFCILEWKDIEYRCVRCHHVKFVRKGGCWFVDKIWANNKVVDCFLIIFLFMVSFSSTSLCSINSLI